MENKPILVKELGWIFPNETSKYKCKYSIYICPVCSNEYMAQPKHINKGNSSKCRSCSSTITATKHGDCSSRLYRIYNHIKDRCYRPLTKGYCNYGGRGIVMCDEWYSSYDMFKEWAMSNGYSDELTIDRIDNDGNYNPNNCRWATKEVQGRNQRVLRSTNTTGYRGVSKQANCDKYMARILVSGKQIYLGTFFTALEGAIAYDKYVLENNLEHTTNGVYTIKG